MSIFALAWAKLRKQLGSSVYTLYNVQCIHCYTVYTLYKLYNVHNVPTHCWIVVAHQEMKITEFIVGHWSNLGFSWSLGHSHLEQNILQYQKKTNPLSHLITLVILVLVRAECVRCPWLLAQMKVATIFDICFPHLLLDTLLPFTPEGIVVGF